MPTERFLSADFTPPSRGLNSSDSGTTKVAFLYRTPPHPCLQTVSHSRNNSVVTLHWKQLKESKATMKIIRQNLLTAAVAIATTMVPTFASAAQLSSDAKAAMPKDIQ